MQISFLTSQCSQTALLHCTANCHCIHAAQSKRSDNLLYVKATNVEPIVLTAVAQVCLILLISVHGP